ncbi:MAG: tail fiber domain-containing protein, partial [Verrucomicrobiota bacterium]
ASGAYALQNNTNGNSNTADGVRTLYTNTSGSYNTANGTYALYANISGNNNTASGTYALWYDTNGSGNTAVGSGALGTNTSGSYNIALGYGAGGAITTGSSNIDIGNAGFAADTNIVRIGSSQTATYLPGTVYAGTMALTSDRNVKDAFDTINPQAVLARVSALPITEWQYKTDTEGSRHIGPMAQDFHAAFGLNGGDDRHISVVDEGGVALAAIQGLNQKVEAGDRRLAAENAELKRQNDLLEKRLERLEQLINTNSDAAK